MDSPQDFKSVQDQIQAALIATTRTVGQIVAEDLGFQRSLNPEVGSSLDEQNARLLDLAGRLLKSAASLTDAHVPILEEVDDIDNNWRGIVDVVDSLLEKADSCLDEYTGLVKRKDPGIEQAPAPKAKRLGHAFRNQNLVKPQLAFKKKPDNASSKPWMPLLRTKPHAIVPLEKSLTTFTDDLQHEQHRHPYETEILQLKYPDSLYKTADPINYHAMQSTSATYVDTYEGILEMLKELKTAKEIAVDLEHHDARSYVGLVSLMQISTREQDWIVDTLKPWREELQVLNEVFADPKILKVFHGAYMDIVWLQRDLGLYINGLFDTHHACKVLAYPGGSLAYLLKRFVNFDADKQYQMADWRIRPLPEEMFYYARSDTHFLLYIYDNLRNELVERSDLTIDEENRIELVLQKSKETSLLRYESQIYDEKTGRGAGGWYSVLYKMPGLLSKEQFSVFRAVHAWRDILARQDDDSTNYVMPNHVIFTLAKLMPTDLMSLHSALRPISHNVKSRVEELLEVIKDAKENGHDGPSMMEVLRPDSVGAVAKAMTKDKAEPIAVPTVVVDEKELRSEKSGFWGGAFGSSTWEKPAGSANGRAEIRLAIPLPPVASNAFSDNIMEEMKISEVEVEVMEIAVVKEEVIKDEPFTLKSGKKRKIDMLEQREVIRREAETSEPSGEYDISLNDLDEEELERAGRKAERRAAKKAKKEQRLSGNSRRMPKDEPEDEPEDEEPFDYTKAESVLNKKHTADQQRGSKTKKPFDPYSKSGDAAKGMRRSQTERAGKSFTFKS